MITAVDTNVLLDVFGADPTFLAASRGALRSCLDAGSLVACDVVWAELSAAFPSPARLRDAMGDLGVGYSSLDQDAALAAGAAWKEYRRSGGRRDRIITDFLIGAHAAVQADRLLTRDRGFSRAHFADLELLDPTR